MYTNKNDWSDNLVAVLLNASEDALQVVDSSGKLLYANQKVADTIGVDLQQGDDVYVWEFDEAIGGRKAWENYIDRLRRHKLIRTRGIRINQTTPETGNVEITTKIVTVDCREYVLSFFELIDDRIEEEEKLRSITELLRKTSELAVIGGWRLDLLTEEISWTEPVYDIFNVTRGSLISKRRVCELIEPESREVLKVAVEKSINEGASWKAELQLVGAGSEVGKWIRSQGRLEIRDGRAVAIYGVVQEVNRLKQLETRLKQLETENLRKQKILSALSHGIERLLQEKDFLRTLPASFAQLGQATEVDRVYLFKANKTGTEVVSYSQQIEWSSHSSLPQIENPELQEMPTTVMGDSHGILSSGKPWEQIVRELEGSQSYEILSGQGIMSILLLPVFIDADTYYGFIGFDDCFHERSWSEDERSVLRSFCNSLGNAIRRQRDKKILTQKNSDLGRLMDVTSSQNERLLNFAYITSHNIRSHAGNIQGLLTLFENESSKIECDLFFKLLKESSSKLVSTINGLNEIVSQNVSNKELPLSEYSLKEAFKDASIAVNNEMQRLGVQVNSSLTDYDRIAAHHAYLDSIMLNLLTNAIKYRSMERTLQLTLSCIDLDEDHFELVFTDNGSGIDLEKHRRELFGMYKTFHNHQEATGLGLYLTKLQVEAMGGSIRVESKVNQGTTFFIKLKKWQRN